MNSIFHRCSLNFLHSHTKTNRVAGKKEGVLTAMAEEDIERCMFVLLFHIVLFCISFMVCIYVKLVVCLPIW
jgi:hypothetical protein